MLQHFHNCLLLRVRNILFAISSLFIALVFIFAWTYAFLPEEAAQSLATLDDEEYEVLAAAIEQIYHPTSSGYIVLTDSTATFECNPSSINVSIDGCSGMRTQEQTPDQILSLVRDSIPKLTDEIIADLKEKSQKSVHFTKPLPLQVKHVLWGPSSTSEWPKDNPELMVLASRAGFNKEKTQALLYIGAMSYVDASLSFGEYVYLVKKGKDWSVKDRMRVWKLL